MFDAFMGGPGGPGGFGNPGGFGGYDDGMDPYGSWYDEEPDEHQDMLMRLVACMPLYQGVTFEDTLENACYVCNVDSESLTEEDIDWLREMTEEE